MTKDVLVSISGLHTEFVQNVERSGEEADAIEVVTPAAYYLKNGKHYIVYDEVAEGTSSVTKNRIKINEEGILEISKSGISNSHMIFEKNKQNLSYYRTPYGQMLLGVNTKKIDITIEEDRIGVELEYELSVNHEALADCAVTINIYSKETAPFS